VVTGLIGAVVLPVVGVGVGAAQIVRGVANTPSAIKQARRRFTAVPRSDFPKRSI